MQHNQQFLTTFNHRLVILGFGAIGKAIMPLIFRHLDIPSTQITVITKEDDAEQLALSYGLNFAVHALTPDNYHEILENYLSTNDFLLNLSVDVSSASLIQFCQAKGVLYTDTCIEPWAGGYTDSNLSASLRSNYAIRESLLALRDNPQTNSTALVAHGANPGLVSHFVKQALLNIAKDTGVEVTVPTTRTAWAELAKRLNIKVIHIAERDTQVAHPTKRPNEFVNTWSIKGFVDEGMQPAELGWGSHEKHWPNEGCTHEFGAKNAIFLNRPGALTKVRTWTPMSGPFHGYLITHTEAMSISDYFTLKKNDELQYRPTVHFAYHPCEAAVLSVNECVGREWQTQDSQRILLDEITDGIDELGVLLMGHAKNAYWFGSQLSIHSARECVPYNNATSLQVAVGAFAGMLWVMANPQRGIVEPDEADFQFILKIALPYLGKVCGSYTDWTPLKQRVNLFPEKIDHGDPWQFINMLVA